MDDMLLAWLKSPVGSQAELYLPAFKVFPVHGVQENLSCTCGNKECKNIGKHPFTRHGLNDASNDINEVAALFQYRADLNIAIRTGSVSGFFALDVDVKKGGAESMEKMINTHDELPPSITVVTGNGYHVYFTYPLNMDIINKTNLMPGIDIRGNGGYVVGIPSKHVSGNFYTLHPKSPSLTAEAPLWFLNLITAEKPAKNQLAIDKNSRSGETPQWSVEEVNRMLDVLDPAMGYDDWLRIGMGLHSGGFIYDMWDTWSSKSTTNYQPGCCIPHWKSFRPDGGVSMGTLVQQATNHGWKPCEPEREKIDTSNVDELVKKGKKLLASAIISKQPKINPAIIGFDALKLPGLIGDTVRWITQIAMWKQPEMALLNTLAFAGAVFGRRYQSPRNTRTNLYAVAIADTGAGKEHSRKALKELAHAAGLDDRIGADDIRSDSGLLRGLMNNASQIMMLDEFGHFLQSISNEKSPHYIRSQARILLKLYSASNSIYHHGDYADAKAKAIVLQSPNLCIYGTSTEETYAKSLKKSAIEDGQLNRFITIRARNNKQYPDRVQAEYFMDESIKNRWAEFSSKAGSSIGEIVNSSDIAPEPITVKWGECEEIQYKIQCRQVDKTSDESYPLRHLWGRLFENTVKIALILAVARNKSAPTFKADDFDIAQMIVESSIAYQESLANDHMSETPYEESSNEIVNAIKSNGGKMSRWEIRRHFRKIKGRDFDDLINSLIEQQVIEAEKVMEEGRGRPRTCYSIINDGTRH